MESTVLHPEYCYVDTALDGAKNRNNVMLLSEVHDILTRDAARQPFTDAYTTMFRFKREYFRYCRDTGSVKKALFPHYSSFVWFDLDHKDDLNIPMVEAQHLIQTVCDSVGGFNKASGSIEVYFSGAKGFHVGFYTPFIIPGATPDLKFNEACRAVVMAVKDALSLTTVDDVYDINRLWRVPGTINSKTGKFKTRLDVRWFLQQKEFDTDEIQK
jgi:hypothetical protein